MHHSIAKALLKGQQRSSIKSIVEKQNQISELISKTEIAGRKKTLNIFEQLINQWGAFELMRLVKPSRSSWHKRSFQLVITPGKTNMGELGQLHTVCGFAISTRDIVRLNKMTFYRNFMTPIFLHDHFLERIMQRTDPVERDEINATISEFTFILAMYHGTEILLSLDLPEESDYRSCYHMITPKHILIATFTANHQIFVLNTILTREQFTHNQSKFYEQTLKNMNDINCIKAVYIERNGETIDPFNILDNYDKLMQLVEKFLIEDDYKSV